MRKLFPKYVLIGLFLLAIGGAGWFMHWLWEENRQQKITAEQLLKQLQEVKEAKNEATITKRISTQLEEIAYQQKEISDNQRQEAVHQTKIADQMRIHAEFEKERAVAAQQTALEAYAQMETQKKLAETRKEEAEQAKQKADILAQLALARSLGSQASTQYAAGNTDLARLLSYASWKFTSKNNGNLYQPEVFNALSTTSEMTKQWNTHVGSIRDINYFTEAGNDYLVTASQYGEIFIWQLDSSDNVVLRRKVIADSHYDFRKLQIDQGQKYLLALSYSGHILYADSGFHISVNDFGIVAPIGLEKLADTWVVACKNGEIFKVSIADGSRALLYKHSCGITAFYSNGKEVLLGDGQGALYRLKENGTAEAIWQQIRQPITAIYKDQTSIVLGYENGRIAYKNITTGKTQELVGHLSRVTALQIIDKQLYTGSLDGTVRLWGLNDESKITSFVLAEQKKWIYVFRVLQEKKLLITGNGKGELWMSSISPKAMAATIRKMLNRNFTTEEWNYYIGELSEYETYK